MNPNMVGKLAPNSSHLTRELIKYVTGRGYFRAVSYQNGDKMVTSPPSTIVELVQTSANRHVHGTDVIWMGWYWDGKKFCHGVLDGWEQLREMAWYGDGIRKLGDGDRLVTGCATKVKVSIPSHLRTERHLDVWHSRGLESDGVKG